MTTHLASRHSGLAPTLAPRAPDKVLVERALDGDRRAFEELVERHQRPLANHIYRLIGAREAALDLAQEVFLKVYVSLDSFDPQYRFTTWLYRIASNCAIDHLRRRRIPTCSLEGVPESCAGSGTCAPVPGKRPSPHEVLRLRELETRVEEAIATLPSRLRELILLRHQRHCRYDEIVRITGLPMGTIKNRIFRARAILRERLADVLDGEV